MSRFLEQMNPQQREGVLAVDGPVLLLAGAGSGKTRVITHRIAYLIEERGIPADSILAVTFTNKAAKEMAERVDHLIGQSTLAKPLISTFHSMCVRILRRDVEAMRLNGVGLTKSFAIYDDSDQQAIVKTALKRLGFDDKQLKPRVALGRISWAKNHMLDPQEYFLASTNPLEERIAHIFKVYKDELTKNNAMDFDDLLLETVRLLKTSKETREKYQKRYRYLLIDEYQDTNRPQYELMRLLSGEHGNVCVVGDEDQSIYSWRGADIKNILDFEKDFPDTKTIRLEQNYRSTQIILEGAGAVVRNNTQRKGKELFTTREGGSLIGYYEAPDGENEALFIADKLATYIRETTQAGDTPKSAVLYRTNSQSRLIEEALRRYNIQYTMVGGFSFYERAEVKDMLCYLKLVQNPHDSIALNRVVNSPPRGIGKTTMETLERIALTTGLSTWDAIDRVAKEQLLPARAVTALTGFRRLILDARAMLGPNFGDALAADAGLTTEEATAFGAEFTGEEENISSASDANEDTSFDTTFNFRFDFGGETNPTEERSTIAPENARNNNSDISNPDASDENPDTSFNFSATDEPAITEPETTELTTTEPTTTELTTTEPTTTEPTTTEPTTTEPGAPSMTDPSSWVGSESDTSFNFSFTNKPSAPEPGAPYSAQRYVGSSEPDQPQPLFADLWSQPEAPKTSASFNPFESNKQQAAKRKSSNEIFAELKAKAAPIVESTEPTAATSTRIDGFRAPGDPATLPELIKFLNDRSGYIKQLENEGTPEAHSRIENLKELANAAQDAQERAETLSDFLDHAALVSDADAINMDARVTLMTLHAAKGLEFPLVFLCGMEEGLFPSSRTMQDPAGLEEERRLCYVGMTRAMDTLVMTRARYRRRYGSDMPDASVASRFLEEVPSRLVENLGSPDDRPVFRADTGYGGYGGAYGKKWPKKGGDDFGGERHYSYEDEDQSGATPAPKPRNNYGLQFSAKKSTETGKKPDSIDNIASFFGGGSKFSRPKLDIPEQTGATSLNRGSQVRHPKYGEGRVVTREGDGPDAKITVEFRQHGVKKLVEKFAQLERLSL